MLPFQHCVSSLQGTLGDGLPALDRARDLIQGLRQANGLVFGSQRDLALRLDGLGKPDPRFLLHQYNIATGNHFMSTPSALSKP